MRLIKLPNSIGTIDRLSKLIDAILAKRLHEKVVDEFLSANPRLNKSQLSDKLVIDYLKALLDKPKLLTFSFSQEADREFIEELVDWARKNIDEVIFVEIKIEPEMIGGVKVRTSQKIYDFSWRSKFYENKHILERLVSNVK